MDSELKFADFRIRKTGARMWAIKMEAYHDHLPPKVMVRISSRDDKLVPMHMGLREALELYPELLGVKWHTQIEFRRHCELMDPK